MSHTSSLNWWDASSLYFTPIQPQKTHSPGQGWVLLLILKRDRTGSNRERVIRMSHTYTPPGGEGSSRVIRDDNDQWEVELHLNGKPDDVNISGTVLYVYLLIYDSLFMTHWRWSKDLVSNTVVYITVNHQNVLIRNLSRSTKWIHF